MDNFLIYLLKVSAGTALLYLTYLFFFSRDTFYKRVRGLLILILILPLFFPFLKIPIITEALPAAESISMTGDYISTGTEFQSTVAVPARSFDYISLILWTYIIITGLILLRLAMSIISTYRIIGKGKLLTGKFPRVVI
jgi:N-acetylmuramoyl-L-alanine amidase